VQEENNKEIEKIIDEFHAVRDCESSEESAHDAAQLATTQNDQRQTVARQTEAAEDRIQYESGDKLSRVINLAIRIIRWRHRRVIR